MMSDCVNLIPSQTTSESEGATVEFVYETMPLRESKVKPQSWKDIGEQFAVFYASKDDDGVMWCPDCRAVKEIVEETFDKERSPSALIIYVGQKPEWKSPKNEWRQQPWDVQTIPTIVRLRDGERLVDQGPIKEKLKAFVETEPIDDSKVSNQS